MVAHTPIRNFAKLVQVHLDMEKDMVTRLLKLWFAHNTHHINIGCGWCI